MTVLQRLLLLVCCLIQTSCVGYFQIGGGKSPQSVQIGPRNDPPRSTCPTFELPPDHPTPSYPQYAGTEDADDVIDSLGRELVKMREHHQLYVERVGRAYQEYIRLCTSR